MRIAILGGTSQIARDLVRALEPSGEFKFSLFGRRPEAIKDWVKSSGFAVVTTGGFHDFACTTEKFDAVINFVGSGNPAEVMRIGPNIMDITREVDSLAITYLDRTPNCKYIFFSSGAAFGGDFEVPIDDNARAILAINQLGAHDWYGFSKLSAEVRHRALSHLHIVDLRVFNYFSYSCEIESRFLIADVLRSIKSKTIFKTNSINIWRDYIGPREMAQIVERVIYSEPKNLAVDCFSKSPVDKNSMLECMRIEFGLQYEFSEQPTELNATGNKILYYSKSKLATQIFGYQPLQTAQEIVVEQSRILLS